MGNENITSEMLLIFLRVNLMSDCENKYVNKSADCGCDLFDYLIIH